MSNPFTQVYDDLRSPYLHEKKAKKDYDGDGKVESGSKEHAGVVHNAIQKKKGGTPDGKDTRTEGKAYGLYKGDGKVRIGKKEEKKPPRTAKGAMAYDGPNKRASEARDRVIAKTKAKRAKLKKEDWRADLGFEIVEHHKTDADGNVIPHEEEAVVQEDLSKIKDTVVSKGKDLVTGYKKFYSKTPVGKVFNKVKDAAPLVAKLGTGTTGDGYIGHKSLGIKNPLVKKEHHQKDEDGNVIEHGDGTPASVEERASITAHDVNYGTKAGKDFMSGAKNAAGELKYKLKPAGGMRIKLANSYEPEGEMVEATKGERLDIKTTGIKNKIEINPEMKTEGYGKMAKKKKKKFSESLKQARKNIGMDPNKPSCWKGYKATGTKMKGGKKVPDCKKESLLDKVESDALKMLNAK